MKKRDKYTKTQSRKKHSESENLRQDRPEHFPTNFGGSLSQTMAVMNDNP